MPHDLQLLAMTKEELEDTMYQVLEALEDLYFNTVGGEFSEKRWELYAEQHQLAEIHKASWQKVDWEGLYNRGRQK